MKKKLDNSNQNKNEIKLEIFEKYNILNVALFKLSMVRGLFDGFSFNIFIFTLLIIAIFLIVNSKNKNSFLAISFIISYILSYFLFITSILNVFLYSDYIWIINIIIGLTAVYYGIVNIYKHNKQTAIINNNVKSIKSRVRIDIPLPLLFSIVFLSFILNSMSFVSLNATTLELLLAISKLTVFSYYFYIIIYVIFFTFTVGTIIFLGILFVNNYITVKYKEYTTYIGSIILMLTGLLITFL